MTSWIKWPLLLSLPLLNLFLFFSNPNWWLGDPSELWARQVLQGLPKNAVYFATRDEDIFTFGYLLNLLSLRPDITLLDAGEDAVTDPKFRINRWTQLSVADKTAVQKKWIDQLASTRAIYGLSIPEVLQPPHSSVRPDGFLLQLVTPTSPYQSRRREAEVFFNEKLLPYTQIKMGWTPYLLSHIAFQIGIPYLEDAMIAKNTNDGPTFESAKMGLKNWGGYSPQLWIHLATLFLQDNQESEAEKLLLASIDRSRQLKIGEDAEAWFWLGNLSLKYGQWNAGIQQTKRALALDPYQARIPYQLGLLYKGNSQPELANKSFEMAIARNPEFKKFIHD